MFLFLAQFSAGTEVTGFAGPSIILAILAIFIFVGIFAGFFLLSAIQHTVLKEYFARRQKEVLSAHFKVKDYSDEAMEVDIEDGLFTVNEDDETTGLMMESAATITKPFMLMPSSSYRARRSERKIRTSSAAVGRSRFRSSNGSARMMLYESKLM